MNDGMIRLKTILKENGYKLTPQRRATLEVLLNNQEEHLSTEGDIYKGEKNSP